MVNSVLVRVACGAGLAGCLWCGVTSWDRYQSDVLRSHGAADLGKARLISGELTVNRVVAYQSALKKIVAAAARAPLDPKPYFELAEALAALGDEDGVARVFDATRIGFTEAEARQGNVRIAASLYSKAILRDPANAIYHQRLGDVLERLGDSSAAQEQITKAISLDPYNLTLYVYACTYYRQKGNQEQFELYLGKLRKFYAQANLHGGELDSAVQEFLKSLQEGKGT